MPFGLKTEIIESIQQVLEQNPRVDKAFVFGSRAKGNYKEGSDIDLALKGSITAKDLLDLHGKLEALNLPYAFDLVNYHSISEPALKEHIDRVGMEMYSRWKKGKLGDIAFIVMGQSPLGETCNQDSRGLPLLNGPSEFTSKYPIPIQYTIDPKRICQEGDILFCVRGSTTGRMNWADQGYAIGRGIASVRHINGKSFQPFLKGLLDYELPELLGKTTGSVFPNITGDDLNEQEVLLPPISEQALIAEILGNLDNKIDLLHRQNKTLEQLAETLFRQWFVKEVEGLEEENVLGKFVSFDPGEKFDRNKECRFFDMKCLSETGMYISEGIHRNVSSGSSFRNFDTLLAKITPCLENGKTGFVMRLDEGEIARGSTEFLVMRSKGLVSPYWIYCLSRDIYFREKAIQSMTGTSGRQRVQVNLLKNIKVRINAKKMIEFHNAVSSFFSKIKSSQNKIQTLTHLRDALLPKLMSGEVRVDLENFESSLKKKNKMSNIEQ